MAIQGPPPPGIPPMGPGGIKGPGDKKGEGGKVEGREGKAEPRSAVGRGVYELDASAIAARMAALAEEIRRHNIPMEKVIEEAISADPDNGETYSKPIHKSGRGAGGHCFIKDFAALRNFFGQHVGDIKSKDIFYSLEKKNIELLKSTKKDLDLLEGVYGKV